MYHTRKMLLLFILFIVRARSDCSLCPLNAISCTVNGSTYSHCYYGTNGVYTITVEKNTACLPTNVADPTTYFGYAINESFSSACYNTSAQTCPQNCLSCNQGANNCRGGMYGISMYGSSGALLRFVQCAGIPATAGSLYRGDLFHNCYNSSYGGPLPSVASVAGAQTVGRKRGRVTPTCAAYVCSNQFNFCATAQNLIQYCGCVAEQDCGFDCSQVTNQACLSMWFNNNCTCQG